MVKRDEKCVCAEQGKVPIGLMSLGMVVGGIAIATALPYVLESTGGNVYLWDTQRASLYFMTLRRAVCLSALATALIYFPYRMLRVGNKNVSYWVLYGVLKVGCAALTAKAAGMAVGVTLAAVCPKLAASQVVLRGWRIAQIIDLGVVMATIPLLLLAFEALQAKSIAVRTVVQRLALLAVPFASVGGATLCQEVAWAWGLRFLANS